MGTTYSIACKTCKITRDLDKFYVAETIETRNDALKLSKEIEKSGFRSALAVSFLAEHKGHDCVFFDEHSKCVDELDPFFNSDYREDTDYWEVEEPPTE